MDARNHSRPNHLSATSAARLLLLNRLLQLLPLQREAQGSLLVFQHLLAHLRLHLQLQALLAVVVGVSLSVSQLDQRLHLRLHQQLLVDLVWALLQLHLQLAGLFSVPLPLRLYPHPQQEDLSSELNLKQRLHLQSLLLLHPQLEGLCLELNLKQRPQHQQQYHHQW